MLDVGALTTITPDMRRGAHVDVVETDAGAGDHPQPLGGGERLGVDLGRRAHQDRVDVDDGLEQRGAVGAVAVADLEVGAERLDGGRAQLLGDQHDGAAATAGREGSQRGPRRCGCGQGGARRCALRHITRAAAAKMGGPDRVPRPTVVAVPDDEAPR